MTVSSILEDVSAANEIDNEVRYDDEMVIRSGGSHCGPSLVCK